MKTTTPYPRRALDLVRFLPDPADDANAALVRAAIAADGGRGELRDQLTEDDNYSLLTFARRRAAAALRESERAFAAEAVDALTLITRDRIDFRDLSVDFPLYASRQLGGDARTVALEATSDSEPGTAGAFTAVAERTGTLTLRSCAYIEVSSKYGLGFMDTWASSYNPRGDIAAQVVRIADEVDRRGRYLTEAPHCSDLPSVWFGQPPRGPASERPTGCVSVEAGLVGAHRWGDSLLIFLAELRGPSEAEVLAVAANAASKEDRPHVALAHNDRLLLVIGGSFTRGESPVETL